MNGDQVRDVITKAFAGVAEVEYPEAVSLVCLDVPDMNIGKCEWRGCWVSDYTMPDELQGIPLGRRVDGRLLCDECEVYGGAEPDSQPRVAALLSDPPQREG